MRLIILLSFIKLVTSVDIYIKGLAIPNKPYLAVAYSFGSQVIEQNDAKIDKVTRAHAKDKDDINVKTLVYWDSKNKFLPYDFFAIFKAIETFMVVSPGMEMSAPRNGHFVLAKTLKNIFITNQAFGNMRANVFEGAFQTQKLYLENNLITSVHQATFEDIKDLKQLSLQGNLLQSLPVGVFSSMKDLMLLNLKNNLLTTLPAKFFEANLKLKEIIMDANRFIFIPPLNVPDAVDSVQVLENLCINEIFHNAREFQKTTSKSCNIPMNPYEVLEAYKEQQKRRMNCDIKDKNIILEYKEKIKNLKMEISFFEAQKEKVDDILEAVESVPVCRYKEL